MDLAVENKVVLSQIMFNDPLILRGLNVMENGMTVQNKNNTI